MFGGSTRLTRTRDWPVAKGRPFAAGTGDLQAPVARRTVLAAKHSLQPDKLAGGVAQATTHAQPIFTAPNRGFAQFSTGQERHASRWPLFLEGRQILDQIHQVFFRHRLM
jgi:hypothetical protein